MRTVFGGGGTYGEGHGVGEPRDYACPPNPDSNACAGGFE
jgi:hypothetical protein